MKAQISWGRKNDRRQRGAALVTVMLISALLLTACIAMLTAAGANARNTTDVLAETKAYYAAESGLQATINFLRNDSTVPNSTMYSYANSHPTLAEKLPYNWPTTGTPNRVVIGVSPNDYSANTGSAYSVNADDPDDTEVSTTFTTTGAFLPDAAAEFSEDRRIIYIPNRASADRTEITMSGLNGGTTITFAANPPNPQFVAFELRNVGNGAALASGTKKAAFEVELHVSSPRPGVRTIRGWFEPPSNNTPPSVLKFMSQNYKLLGSTIELCSVPTRPSSSPGCAAVQPNLVPGAEPTYVYGFMTPMTPYRLQVISTGYGPNWAVKKLEGIVRRNFFDGLGSGGATTMIGANCVPGAAPLDHCFDPGNSNGITYSGGNSETGVPSFAVSDPAYLAYIASHPPSNDPSHMQPPPALIGNEVPAWQQTPADLDVLIDQLRTAAQNSGRYFLTPSQTIRNPGDYTTGTGITFCEGSCEVGNQGSGASAGGGGILVVTGKLTNGGGFNFRGLIIVTGEEGWERNGAGGGQIIGNVVIAPYNRRTYVPENLSSTFLPPRYWVTGGGASDIIYSDVSASFDGLSYISDFIAGVAEK